MFNFISWLIAGVLAVITIGLHYEIMRVISDIVMPWALRRMHDRRVMMLMILILMGGHIVEIWIYAFTEYGISFWPEFGHLGGNIDADFSTYLYFSSVSYTGLGFSDVMPVGPIRSISVSEALTGLLMIAWSASFTYLKMEQIWNLRKREPHHDGHHRS